MKSNETKFVAIASQKGGCGKSAITLLLANMLYFKRNKKVLIIDCDIPQNTCANTRRDELTLLKNIQDKINKDCPISADEQELWKQFSKAISEYPKIKEEFSVIIPSIKNLSELPALLPDIKKQKYDVVLFDTVGTLGDPVPLTNLISNMDYVFVPIEAEAKAMQSAMSSLATFQKIHEMKQEVQVFGFFNKLKSAEKEQIKCMRNVLIVSAKMQLPILSKDNDPLYLEDKACFRSPLVQSTMIPSIYHTIFKKSEGFRLLDEMCSKILSK